LIGGEKSLINGKVHALSKNEATAMTYTKHGTPPTSGNEKNRYEISLYRVVEGNEHRPPKKRHVATVEKDAYSRSHAKSLSYNIEEAPELHTNSTDKIEAIRSAKVEEGRIKSEIKEL
jgi:hypothetical protein